MAKKEKRILIAFVCQVCNSQNYLTSKNKIEHKEKMTPSKYCKHCRKKTEHKETEKLD